MIDLHCHILPGVDDGSDSPDTSCRMAAMAADSGVRTIFATPHCNTRDPRKNFRSQELDRALRRLQAELDRWDIPVRVLPGAEVLIREDMGPLLEEHRLQTLNNSRYLLTEFYFDEAPRFMTRQLAEIAGAGLVPVVAHPERYFAVQDAPELAEDWCRRGWVLQVNKGSILGDLGEAAYDTAALLLRREAVGIIASDAHDAERRNPHMGRLLDQMDRRFPALDPDRLLRRNPLRIVKDLEFD